MKLKLAAAIGLALLLPLAAMPATAATAPAATLFLTADVATTGAADEFCGDSDTYGASRDLPAAGKVYADRYAGLACPLQFSHVLTSDHALAGDATLALAIACDQGSIYGANPESGEFGTVSVTKNGVAVANGTWSYDGIAVCGGGSAPAMVNVTLPVDGLMFASGDLFGLTVVLRGLNPGNDIAPNMYVAVGGDNPSAFTAAGLGFPEPFVMPTFNADLANATALIKHNFDQNTTVVYNFNWTAPERVVFGAAGTARNGSAYIQLTAPNGTSVNGTMAGIFGISHTVNGTAGTWQLSIAYDNFTGSLTIAMAPAVAHDEPVQDGHEEAPHEEDADVDTDENVEVTGTGPGKEPDQDVPSPAVALVAVALLGLAYRHRRN